MFSMNTTKQGTIIVIDGPDGSGKATQAKALVGRLIQLGKKVKTVDFPRYKDNFVGALIRECLDGKHGDFVSMDPKIVSVLYAADRFESGKLIEDCVNDGNVVIIDRYVSSNQIHQGGKIGDEQARKEFLAWLDRLEFGVFKIPKPDLIVYLHVPTEISMKLARDRAVAKGEKPDLAESNAKHQHESQESALSIVKDHNNWVKIDCAPDGVLLPPEAVSELVWKSVEKSLS